MELVIILPVLNVSVNRNMEMKILLIKSNFFAFMSVPRANGLQSQGPITVYVVKILIPHLFVPQVLCEKKSVPHNCSTLFESCDFPLSSSIRKELTPFSTLGNGFFRANLFRFSKVYTYIYTG